MTTVEDLVGRTTIPELSPQAEVALLARVLWREGYDDHDSGHITYRQPDDTLLTNPIGLGWNELTASDIVRIDLEGNQLEGHLSAPSAFAFWLEFHKARPEVKVTVHQHPRYTTVWSTAGRIPGAYDQYAATVPDSDIVLYNDYQGIVGDLEPARHAVQAIGNARCALLRNHGCFVVGETIAQTFSAAMALEQRSRQAWMAEVLGAENQVPDYGREEIERGMAKHGWAVPGMWEWAARRELGLLRDVLS